MSSNIRWARFFRILAATAVVVSAGGALQAAQLVTFARGQSIVVQSSQMKNGWYIFSLEGGGEFGVPVAQVSSIEDYEVPPAPTPPAIGAAVPGQAQAGAINPAVTPAGAQPLAGGSAPSPVSALASPPGASPGASQPNGMAAAQDDWRYKVKMSGGPRMGAQNPYGLAGTGGRAPFGAGRPGLPGQQRRPPQQPQNPQN
jgi:hypothetical protein